MAFTSNYFQYVKKNKPHVYLQLSAQELFDINAEYLPDSFFGSPEMQALNDAVDGLNIDEISPILNAICRNAASIRQMISIVYPLIAMYTLLWVISLQKEITVGRKSSFAALLLSWLVLRHVRLSL